ncbi:MazG-like family protein [Streptomyces acidiscabies]|uniref:MazG nucleotide pyrophosphohydrolase domain protein n=1 Tax=Streptomyces acidiscabies TaxID=42234 RepID=A0A0L0KMK1_9ACTN|nr:MazG-like family protein [Streptomyces acidiscabies]KND38835.1 hypothetical protein IQ63_06215 [Streptomyces acidiscabies]
MDTKTSKQITQLKEWLDENAEDQNETERRLLRVLKIGEEFGEVSEALHGALGGNPRKGRSHDWGDVQKELVDVVVTALVALATLNPDWPEEFDARLQHLVERVIPS